MNALVIGGTQFVGPHLVEALRARDVQVTLFNRGRHSTPPQDGVEIVVGDREHDLERLGGRRFDTVVDTCGFVPRIVDISLRALAGATSHYVFVSTISVYADPLDGARDESSTLATTDDAAVETITPETYGPLKALCEAAVLRAMPGAALIVRPGLIVGPLDPTDRFTYWPHRAALGGEMLVPGARDHPLSFIDVRDLAEFIASAALTRLTGTFNAAGDPNALTMGGLIDACVSASEGKTVPVWVDEGFIEENAVEPWSELPVWIPTGHDSLMHASSAKAVRRHLRYRPLPETVRATLEWTRGQGLDRSLKAGLTSGREAELLALWRRR